jgi:inosine-uridine nucleoside N-ribohydrolase
MAHLVLPPSALLRATLLLVALWATAWCSTIAAGEARIPVILDTDMGDDIDDTWALAYLLKSPQFDLKLVTTTFGRASYRARLVAKLLTVAQRTDVAVGLGAGGMDGGDKILGWIADFPLTAYKGSVHQDGVQVLIDTIEAAKEPITLISIGPSDTVAAALAKRPDIAAKARFVGMQGSVRKGYDGGSPSPEWNVKCNIPAAKKALLAPWKEMTITPLDTCALVRVKGERFAALKRSGDPLVKAVLENYRVWSNVKSIDELKESSILFDTVAVYLALPGPRALTTLEDLRITVGDDGSTLISPSGMPMRVATAWTSLDGYLDQLVATLLR